MGFFPFAAVATGVAVTTFTFGSSGAVPSSGTFTAGQVVVDQNQVLRVCTVGGSPGTWRRVGAAPGQFWADDYGAKGDGKVLTAGSGTSGSPTFTDSTNSPFVSGDTGKYIVVNQGATGSNTNPFGGTLTYSSASSVTLSGNLSANASGAPYVYGTDDATAINNCVLAAYNWFVTNAQKAQVFFSAKIYMLGTFTQSTSFSWPSNGGLTGKYNAHIPLPIPSETGPKLQIELIGAGFAPATEFWESLTPQLASGTVLCSVGTSNRTQPDATYGQASVIQASNNGSSSGLTNFINATLTMDGISVVVPWNSPTSGVDCQFLGQMSLPTFRATAFAPVNLPNNAATGGPNLGNSAFSTNSNAGASFPAFLNNAFNYVGWAIVEGFGIGINAAEHFSAEFIFVDYGNIGFQVNAPSANPATHGLTIQYLGVEQANYGMYVFNGSGAGFGNGTCPVFVSLLDMELVFTDHIYDPNNNLVGMVYWNNISAGHPVLAGGQNLIVINTTRNQPGPWSGAPAAPGNGTAQQNLSYKYATIYASVSGGTITNTAQGLASTGLTSTGQTAAAGIVIPIRVGPGQYYSVTYTGTLTTAWWLD